MSVSIHTDGLVLTSNRNHRLAWKISLRPLIANVTGQEQVNPVYLKDKVLSACQLPWRPLPLTNRSSHKDMSKPSSKPSSPRALRKDLSILSQEEVGSLLCNLGLSKHVDSFLR